MVRGWKRIMGRRMKRMRKTRGEKEWREREHGLG